MTRRIHHSTAFVICLVLGALASGCQSGTPDSTTAPGSSGAPVAAQPSPTPSASPVHAQDPELQQDSDEQRMLVLINRHRANNGARPLKTHDTLIRSARWLSEDMAARDYMRHVDSLGRDSFQRMDAFDYDGSGLRGENIADGNGDADATFVQWMDSPGHNANMLNPHYTLIGIARAYGADSKYGWYWTTDFGSD